MGVQWEFSVEGCRRRVVTRMVIWVHFLHRHVQDTVIILSEGNLPYPRFHRCDMLMPWEALKGRHITTA